MNLSSETIHILLIGAIELALLFVVTSIFLVFQNRSLKKLLGKLRSRMQVMVEQIRTTNPSREGKNKTDASYQDFLNQQIKTTHARHLALNSDQDIALDIDPQVPLPRRVAALRFALLQAEREATRNNQPDWDAFQNRYEQIFSYFQDYSPSAEGGANAEEIDLLTLELTNAKKRINNLEKFKALYFDLDERWQSSKDKAQKSYSELSQLAEQVDDSETYKQLLHEYHSAYNEFGEMFERGVESQETLEKLEEAHGEIRHLRAVAAEQHTIISDLQLRLETSTTDEEKAQIVGELQVELQTQIRYVQESETCIKLLEDELTNANKELEQLRTRVNLIPGLKTELAELKDKNEEFDQQVYSLKSDNRRLTRKLEQIVKAPPPDSAELPKYKKALAELQAKYNELEEKYLDVKMQQ